MCVCVCVYVCVCVCVSMLLSIDIRVTMRVVPFLYSLFADRQYFLMLKVSKRISWLHWVKLLWLDLFIYLFFAILLHASKAQNTSQEKI